VTMRVPYPLGSTRSGWTAASTIPMRAGRVAASGQRVDESAVPHGDGQGHDEQGHEVPGSSGPAREIARRTVTVPHGRMVDGWVVDGVSRRGVATIPIHQPPSYLRRAMLTSVHPAMTSRNR
jgi:hypothetical protein